MSQHTRWVFGGAYWTRDSPILSPTRSNHWVTTAHHQYWYKEIWVFSGQVRRKLWILISRRIKTHITWKEIKYRHCDWIRNHAVWSQDLFSRWFLISVDDPKKLKGNHFLILIFKLILLSRSPIVYSSSATVVQWKIVELQFRQTSVGLFYVLPNLPENRWIWVCKIETSFDDFSSSIQYLQREMFFFKRFFTAVFVVCFLNLHFHWSRLARNPKFKNK